ncbi:MAG: hypothetical protein MUC83_18125 [Pirellula sp.]|nr:hypothetical protein [Pirellula sp.]
MNRWGTILSLVLLGTVGFAASILIWVNWPNFDQGYAGPSPTTRMGSSQVEESGKQFDWRAIANPHLDECTERIEKSIPAHFEPLIDLLNRARNRVPEFSISALSFGSKWRLALDYVPFTDGQKSPTFLKESFQKEVLSSDDLENAIFEVVQNYLEEVGAAESEMLVNIRADLDDFPSVTFTEWKNDTALKEKFEQAIAFALETNGNDLQASVGSQLVSLIAGEVLTQVAVRMGVSAGIIGAGAASGWATFGVGVVAGVVIDQIVSHVWAFVNDPEKELTHQIQEQIDSLQSLLCNGDDQVTGLKQHFLRIGEERSRLRIIAMENLFASPLAAKITP